MNDISQSEASNDPPALAGSTVLVVDDDARIRRVVRRALERRGSHVIEADDGKTALRILDDAPVDLVITDIFMPNIDGLALILDIRKVYPETKVIAISGGSEAVPGDYLHVAKALGAIKVFQKPLDLEALVAAVEENFGVKEVEDQSNMPTDRFADTPASKL